MPKGRPLVLFLVLLLVASFTACGADGELGPPAAPSEAVAKFLSGWAAPAGTERDAATGYPKRIRRTKDEGEMVLVPEGLFEMGAVPGDTNANEREMPRHAVTLSKAYYLDVNEVTVGQWKKYVSVGGGRMPTDLRSESTDRHPIHNVDHAEARAYAAWGGAALPTEAQWERAARGGHDDFMYPWGVKDEVTRRNGPGDEDGFDGLAPVRSYPPNDYGLYDMAGNVYEWCADYYSGQYYRASPGVDPAGPRFAYERVIRDGPWDDDARYLRSSNRDSSEPTGRYTNVGFRLARTLP